MCIAVDISFEIAVKPRPGGRRGLRLHPLEKDEHCSETLQSCVCGNIVEAIPFSSGAAKFNKNAIEYTLIQIQLPRVSEPGVLDRRRREPNTS